MPGPRFGKPQYVFGLGLLISIGLTALLIQAWHLLGEPSMTVPELVLGVLLPAILGLLLLAFGVRLHRERLDPNEMLLIGSWAGMGFLLFVWIGAGAMLYYLVQDAAVHDPVILTVTIGSAGALAGSLLGVYDVRVRRAREGFRTQRDRAEQLTERLSILNRVFRHDIRTELTVIQGHAQLAREQCEGRTESHLETIVDRADAIERRSEQARTLQATVDRATKQEIVDVCTLLNSIRAELETQYPEASIVVSCPDRAIVRASIKLDAAIEEILENALEHGDSGSIEVDVERGQSTISIGVRDWGPGIPEAEIAILDSAVETPLRHSSGMGLWTVKWIVEAADGTFEIEPVDSGTRVVMELPRAEQQ